MSEYRSGYKDGYKDCLMQVFQIVEEEIKSIEADIESSTSGVIASMYRSFLAEAKSLKEQIEKELQRRNGDEIY